MIDTLLNAPRAQLRARLESGHPIAPHALDDTRYRGISLGLPAWIDRLAWKTFEKTFHRDGQVLRGWNVRLEQTGVQGPVVPLVKRGQPHTFGHYDVVQGERWLELRYGVMVDPLVALEPGGTEWLLGRSDLLGVPTPSYFLLQRIGPLEHIP